MPESTSSLVVLALDGCDLELAHRWDCENLLLDEHRELTTFAYSRDEPYTPEVWLAVATGQHPRVFEGVEMEWDNPLLRAASMGTRYLPMSVRQQLGDLVGGKSDGMDLAVVDAPHAFDHGAAKGWPGITPAENLVETWRLLTRLKDGDASKEEHHSAVVSNFHEELGWARGQHLAGTPIAGVHLHLLDTMGHHYARRPEQLREWYRLADRRVGELREEIDRLVVLSDHGMQTVAVDGDEEPGMHSWRAMIAGQGVETPLPEKVFDVRAWLESQVTERAETEFHSDTTTEQLRALGYV